MTITGIITEYNPFHNGHLYHLKKSKKIAKTDQIICVMNGNFMQRGSPAFLDKWSRTAMALKNGVDLVIELPLIYGIRSAEYFASGALKTLAATGVVDSLVFGSEYGKIDPLVKTARLFLKEPDIFKNQLKFFLKKGLSFPEAREKALKKFLKINNTEDDMLTKIISRPNNILGIEYIKAILKYNFPIKPLTIKRSHDNYHKKTTEGKIASATAIRKLIREKKLTEIKNFVPEITYQIIKKDFKKGKIPVRAHLLGIMLLDKLRRISIDELKEFAEINNGLENRIKNAASISGSLEQLIKNIKSKKHTRTRIQRNLLHVLFNLKAKDFQEFDQTGITYLKVLGFNQKGEKILSRINKNSSRPIITQPAKYLKSININNRDTLKKQLSYDLLASDIYSLLYYSPDLRQAGADFYKQIIKE